MNRTVVIAGGGPAGLMLACELGLAGVDAVVVERAKGLRTEENSRGYTIHARSVELLDRRGLMDTIRKDQPMVWPRIHFANIWIDLTAVIDEEYSLLVPQSRTEQVLEERAIELGVDIRHGHEVISVAQDETHATVGISSDEGEYDIRCHYLAGCDGGDSTVRALAGFEAPTSGTTWYGVLADFKALDDEWEWGSPTYPGGLFAVIPHPDASGLLRLMTMEFDTEAPGDNVPVTADELKASIRRITGKDFRQAGEPKWICRYANVTRHAQNYRQGRVFLVGDAAHLYYFGAGHGLNGSLQDAMNLGWKLAADIHGWAPPGLLDTYHAERHPVGHQACMSSQAQMALLHPMDRVAPLRELFEKLMSFDDVRRYLTGVVTDVRYPFEYPERPTGTAMHPLLGWPAPPVPLTTRAHGQTTVAAILNSGRGVVLDLSGGTARLADAAGWADRVDVVTAEPTKAIEAATLLIRPDGHVVWADTAAIDVEGLRLALTTWFGAGTGLTG